MSNNARGGALAALPTETACAGTRQQRLAEPHDLSLTAGELTPAVKQHAVAARGR
ncbi:hypothetical protein [Streptomyces ochraceiscleroticus]|uniref:Uncharacterized protein n=1 Tax=Streptomyces ochraceiscleroticus TaxID=47761 RepID=A0ABW1MTI7_9ACTN|nr:hypothetical protein [Streptomyces ochraceiscleroticus]